MPGCGVDSNLLYVTFLRTYLHIIKILLVRPSFWHSKAKAHFVEGLLDEGQLTVLCSIGSQEGHVPDECICLCPYLETESIARSGQCSQYERLTVKQRHTCTYLYFLIPEITSLSLVQVGFELTTFRSLCKHMHVHKHLYARKDLISTKVAYLA